MELLRMDDQRHDVFICFRGDEPFGTSTIRRAIVEPLFDSLTGSGASVFMDDESIESGQPISDTILQGILRTRGGGAALILVSPDFFSRVWPLIELACFYQTQHYPDRDQIHLFIVCLNVTPEYIKQAAFVKEKCPGIKEIKFVVAPTHIRCNESTQVVGWLSETVLNWIKSTCVALGRTRKNSFNYFKTSLLHLPNQAEIGESLATYAELNDVLVSNQPVKLSKVFAAAALANQLTEENVLALSLVLSAFKRDGQFLETVDIATKYLNQYNKKWLSRQTVEQCPDLSQQKQQVEQWFYSQASFPQRASEHAMASQGHALAVPPMQIVQIVANENDDVRQLSNLFDAAVALGHQVSAIVVVAVFLAFINNIPVAQAFGFGSLYLAFRKEDADLASIHNNPKVQIVTADNGVEFEIDATNTWSWPLTLDEHGVLNDTVRNNLALLIASFGLEGICRFRVHQILSSEENDRYAVFFMPSERDIQTTRSIFEQKGFMEKFEQAYNTFDTIAKDQVAFCGGCGVVQRTSPDNPYLCRLGHLQAVHILDQPIPQETAVGFEWMSHNLDRRVDLLISCEQNDETASSLNKHFLHDTYSVITSANRKMSSFLQAVLSTRGGGIALVLMTKNYMIQSRTISELACLYAVRQDIRLIIACVGTTKSQVLQNVIIRELCPDLSSHLFMECDSGDSVDSLLKNQISQELLQHVIPGFRRDQSYLVLKDRLAARFATSPGGVFTKIAINLDLESNSVMNWSDLLKQAELHGKFGEEQMDLFRQAILILPETELNSNDRTAALNIIQQYEKKWLADWTSKEVPALDKIDERAHLVNSRFRAPLYKTLTGHTDTVFSVAFSSASQLIASAGGDRVIRLWSIQNGELNTELKGHKGAVLSVAFSPDGTSIVSGTVDCAVRTWSVATKQQVKILNGHSNSVQSVAWSPNGDVIASGSFDRTVILWDSISGSMKKTLTGHTDWAFSVSFSQNGNKLASAGWDKTAIIWDVNSGAALIKLAHSNVVWSVCFSPDDQVVTGCGDNIVRMFNVNSGHEEKRFEGHIDPVTSVAISFDGLIIASGSSDSSVRLWDVASTKQLHELDDRTKTVWSVAFSHDGKFIASGSSDRNVRLWNAPIVAGTFIFFFKKKNQTITTLMNFTDANLTNACLANAITTNITLLPSILTGANLSGGIDLCNANLSGYDLTSTNLSHANLTHANLTNTALFNADLSYANLTDAIVTEKDSIVHATLIGANLTRVNLSEFDLSGKDLSDVDLTDANLSGTQLNKTIMNHAVVREAILDNAALVGVKLVGVDLSSIDLSERDLSKGNLSKANLRNANLSKVTMFNTDLSEADLSGSILVGGTMTGSKLNRANISECDLSQTNLSNADLSDCNINGTIFTNATLNGSKFCRVDLSGRDLSGFDLSNVDLTGSNLSNANLSNCNLTNSNLTGSNLTNTTLTGSTLTGANFSDVDLAGRDFSNFNLTNVNFTHANLTNANLTNVDLINANLSNTTFKNGQLVSSNFTNATLAGSSICRFERISPGTSVSNNGRTAKSTGGWLSAVASIGCSAGTLSWIIRINDSDLKFGIWNSNDTPPINAYRNPNSICVENGGLYRAGLYSLPSIQLSPGDVVRVTVDAAQRAMTINNTTKGWTQRIKNLPVPNPAYYPHVCLSYSSATIEF